MAIRHCVPDKTMYGIYHRLKSKFWDGKTRKSRAIAGTTLVSSFDTKEFISQVPNDGQSLYVFTHARQLPAGIRVCCLLKVIFDR